MENYINEKLFQQEPRLTPVAYLDDLSGKKLIVQIGDSKDFAILLPPDYRLDDAGVRGAWVFDAAVSKYGFIPIENEIE